MHKEAAKADGSDSSVSIALLPLSQHIFLASQRIPRTHEGGRTRGPDLLIHLPGILAPGRGECCCTTAALKGGSKRQW